ncbi:MAG: 2-dehydropantoate 2-reductase [Spirochaetota bacterium]|nr:MAG: 2-dehydropantoate 2-reductase [Spirochaetota bacterium]
MGNIKRVIVIGAGAIGGYFVSRFLETDGFATAVAARGQRRKRLETEGLVVNGKKYNVPVVDPDEADSPSDLIIVAVKNHHLADAVNNLEKLVSNHTTFISVMNGLDSEDYIGSIYGMDKVLYAISVGIVAIREENRITYINPGLHYFGEKSNTKISQNVKKVQEAFERAGIYYKTPPDMVRMLWWKFMINVGINQASAVMHAPYSVFQTDPEARGFMESLMREVTNLAEAVDINLVEKDITSWYPVLDKLAPNGKTSMLQDIEAGRKTEVEAFGGEVVSLGKAHNIPTPVNQTVVNIIHVLERNTGKT